LHERLGTTFIYVTHDQIEAMTMATRIAVIKDGILQQVGTPEDLYFRPENVFVAGFIGSPSMNFFVANLAGSSGQMSVAAGGIRLALPPDRGGALAGHLGQEVVLGVRPEDIYDPRFQPAGIHGQSVRATVDVSEMMGNEKFLHLLVDGQQFLARVDPRTRARPGQEIDVLFDLGRVHLFDTSTNLALDKIEIPEELQGGDRPQADRDPAT
jgi:multiple sugar transport system ATP-binding protein